MQGNATLYLLIAVAIIAVIAVIYLTMSMRTSPALNKQRYQAKWLEIEHGLARDNPSSYALAVLNADKLLDLALKERRFKGQTMGERMKAANAAWKNPNHVWGAHKIRNQLAHESDFHIDHQTALRALAAFKQGLKDLGAI